MLKLTFLLFFILPYTNSIADDGVMVLSDNPTDIEIEVVREAAYNLCNKIIDCEKGDECAADYLSGHNYEGDIDCD
jgi:hypothetical protein